MYLLSAWEFRKNNAFALQFNTCLVHSHFGFVHLTHQNLSAHEFCLNSLAKKIHSYYSIIIAHCIYCYCYCTMALQTIRVDLLLTYNLTRTGLHSAATWLVPFCWYIFRLNTAYLIWQVNLDKIMQARWNFDASSAQTWRLSTLDKHQNWSARFRSALVQK